MNELLEAARQYTPRTVPLRPGRKEPAVPDWLDWTASEETVTEYWSRRPDLNVGIRTGNRLAVIDVDPREGGDLELARLQRQHNPLPSTPEVATGGNGRHLYFRAPAALRSTRLAPGLELKAAGCQVVAPPSVHPVTGKLYVWHPAHPLIEREIAPLPVWVTAFAGVSANHQPVDLATRDPLHAIPSTIYVPKLTGRPINHGGFIHCPFHRGGQERRPALKVYDGGGWKCDACGAGGRIYQLAGLLGGWPLPLTPEARRAIRAELIAIFAQELAA